MSFSSSNSALVINFLFIFFSFFGKIVWWYCLLPYAQASSAGSDLLIDKAEYIFDEYLPSYFA